MPKHLHSADIEYLRALALITINFVRISALLNVIIHILTQSFSDGLRGFACKPVAHDSGDCADQRNTKHNRSIIQNFANVIVVNPFIYDIGHKGRLQKVCHGFHGQEKCGE